MEIKLISREALKMIYEEHMVLDFPADELKPWAAISALYDRGVYQSYGLYDGEALLGYACLTKQAEADWLLLDYYAICAKYRSHGYGSQFITKLWEALKDKQGIFVEIELIACAKDEAEREIRTRRRQFYLRNGLVATRMRTRLFGVDYEMLFMPCAAPALSDEALLKELCKVYQTMLPPKVFDAYVKLELAE